MRQIRTEASGCGGDAYRGTSNATGGFENTPTGDRAVIERRSLLLRADPSIKFLGRVDRHAQQHFRVLRPAILRALAEEDTRAMRIQPHLVYSIWNQV